MTDAAVRVHGITKRYGTNLAVRDLRLEIAHGEVFGLLGPNGSGKTTTILMILGLTEPDRGEISVLGLDPRRQPISVKRRVGYLPDAVGFYEEMSGRENLRYTARLNGMDGAKAERKIAEVLERMGLAAAGRQPVATYSRGMRQRLGLADVLLKEPRIAIMDEPTLGLDPQAAQEFLALIGSLKADGVTVLLSSHLLHQVQSVCDRMGLFAQGEMRLVGRFEELARRVIGGQRRLRARVANRAHAARLVAVAGAVAGCGEAVQDGALLTFHAQRDIRRELLAAAAREEVGLLELYEDPIDLQEIYTGFYDAATDG